MGLFFCFCFSLIIEGQYPMDMILLWIPVLLGLGAVSGFLAGLLGIGGGIVLVPGLFFALNAFGYDGDHVMHIAIGTSLAIIIPTGVSSVRAHWKHGAVQIDLVRRIGIGILAGVAVGTVIANHITGETLNIIFAGALLLLAVIMASDPSRFSLADKVPGQPWSAMMGAVIGMLSTLMGIGGATISVPYMTLHRVPIHQAIATASALGLLISIPAALGFILIGWGVSGLPPFSVGYVNLLACAVIVPASVLMAPFGARVAHRVAVRPLRRIFAIFIAVVAVRMWYEVAGG